LHGLTVWCLGLALSIFGAVFVDELFVVFAEHFRFVLASGEFTSIFFLDFLAFLVFRLGLKSLLMDV